LSSTCGIQFFQKHLLKTNSFFNVVSRHKWLYLSSESALLLH
jgi:hypothetical protein